MDDARIKQLTELCEKATEGPWEMTLYESGTAYVHMRHASSKSGPSIKEWDASDQDGHVGARMFLYNVAAFSVLTGETESDLEREKIANAAFIAEARTALPEALAQIAKLNRVVEAARKRMAAEADAVKYKGKPQYQDAVRHYTIVVKAENDALAALDEGEVRNAE